ACVEGLAVFADRPDDDFAKCSMGLGYTGMGAGTFEQEVAHNLGRAHAPCGNPDAVDGDYPYGGAKIGVWGYSLTQKTLFDPARFVDFMSYCPRTWVSDYTFSGLFDRIAIVNQVVAAWSAPRTPVSYRMISVEPNGHAAIGDVAEFVTPPAGRAA